MGQRYSNVMLLFMITVSYGGLISYIGCITFLGLLYQYWLVKILLIYIHKKPPMMGNSITLFYLSLLPWITVLYSITLFIWFWDLNYFNWYFFTMLLMITIGVKFIIEYVI
jgi:hypothetical protein